MRIQQWVLWQKISQSSLPRNTHLISPPKCAVFLRNLQEQKPSHTNALVQEKCKKESPTRAPTVWAWYKFLRPATFFVHIGASEAEVTVVIGNDDPIWSFLGCSQVRNQIYLQSIQLGHFPPSPWYSDSLVSLQATVFPKYCQSEQKLDCINHLLFKNPLCCTYAAWNAFHYFFYSASQAGSSVDLLPEIPVQFKDSVTRTGIETIPEARSDLCCQ